MNQTSRNSYKTPYYEELIEKTYALGGIHNAHLHLDRAGTYNDKYFTKTSIDTNTSNHISLSKKHALIANIHESSAYDSDDLEQRLRFYIEQLIEFNTRKADTMIDVTPDRVQLNALRLMRRLAEEYKDRIELTAASYTPLGFSDADPQRWDIFAEGVKEADFIGALPEADDIIDYPTNIGFEEHCDRVLELSNKHGKMVHFHTDQRNEPSEAGTERLLECIKRYGVQSFQSNVPQLWAVHMVSPSTYRQSRFDTLVENLLHCNVGVICCPSAAVGMRQIRSAYTPTYNSIPRVLELLAAGVKVRLASDNIADICSPSTTADIIDEVFVLSAALRFYNTDILAHLAAGVDLTLEHIELIKNHLRENDNEINKVITHYDVQKAVLENNA